MDAARSRFATISVPMLCGFHRPDAGQIFVNDTEVTLRSVDHARSLGIDTVYQEVAPVNELSVYPQTCSSTGSTGSARCSTTGAGIAWPNST
jgi:ABC-type sugar transport system ATPase subunit